MRDHTHIPGSLGLGAHNSLYSGILFPFRLLGPLKLVRQATAISGPRVLYRTDFTLASAESLHHGQAAFDHRPGEELRGRRNNETAAVRDRCVVQTAGGQHGYLQGTRP